MGSAVLEMVFLIKPYTFIILCLPQT